MTVPTKERGLRCFPPELKRYRNERLTAGASNATVNREISQLRMVFFTDEEWRAFLAAFSDREAWSDDWHPTPVRIDLPKKHGGPRPPSDQQRDTAFTWFASFRPSFEGLLYVAGRLSEARMLNWEHVDLEAGTVLLTQQKTQKTGLKTKLVHISSPLRRVLDGITRGIGGHQYFVDPTASGCRERMSRRRSESREESHESSSRMAQVCRSIRSRRCFPSVTP